MASLFHASCSSKSATSLFKTLFHNFISHCSRPSLNWFAENLLNIYPSSDWIKLQLPENTHAELYLQFMKSRLWCVSSNYGNWVVPDSLFYEPVCFGWWISSVTCFFPREAADCLNTSTVGGHIVWAFKGNSWDIFTVSKHIQESWQKSLLSWMLMGRDMIYGLWRAAFPLFKMKSIISPTCFRQEVVNLFFFIAQW